MTITNLRDPEELFDENDKCKICGFEIKREKHHFNEGMMEEWNERLERTFREYRHKIEFHWKIHSSHLPYFLSSKVGECSK